MMQLCTVCVQQHVCIFSINCPSKMIELGRLSKHYLFIFTNTGCIHVHIQLSCLLHVPTHCMCITYKYFKIEFHESGQNPCPPVDLWKGTTTQSNACVLHTLATY